LNRTFLLTLVHQRISSESNGVLSERSESKGFFCAHATFVKKRNAVNWLVFLSVTG
jgi:hypothetical protein